VFLPLGDDDGAGISPDVDDIAQVVVGVVVGLSGVLLDALVNALAAFGALLVAGPAPFLLVVIVFSFHLDGDLDAWRRAMRFALEVGCYLSCSRLDLVIGEVLFEVGGVVVVQVDSFHRVVIVVDLHESYHQDFS